MYMYMKNFGLKGTNINLNFLNKKNKSAVMKDNMVLLGEQIILCICKFKKK